MIDVKAILGALRAAVDAGSLPEPVVRSALAMANDPVMMRQAGRILSRLRPSDNTVHPVRVHVLATGTPDPFQYFLHSALVGAGVLPLVGLSEYGRFELALGSATFTADGDPDVVSCLMDSSYFLPADWDPTDVEALGGRFESRLADLRGLLAMAVGRSAATFVLHTIPLPAVVRDTVIGWRSRTALTRLWYRLNADILGLAQEYRQVAVVDLVGELAETPATARDDRLHHFGDIPYTDGALLALAQQVRRVVQSRLGLSRKVLAVDLDNTLWGGVVAEVGGHGIELGGLYPGRSYAELQHTAHRLHEQGVLLVLVSKNDPDLVEEVIAEHPAMVLRGETFAVRAVNWGPKPANLRKAAHMLDLSPESFVFMDDSEFEREQV
ncbi:MAG TPA: HAD-IIIC family phosphatase, partial [Pseudonocardiaceae bacterium]|nr:HAD-IIIC family phosphatase [Pseudonocardiaceae bacterium]